MKNREHQFFLICLALCLPACQSGVAAGACDPDAVRLKRFLETDFQVFKTSDSVLIGVGTEKGMAEPGAPFNVTDAVEDADLPFQRLRFWGRSDSLWFVYYEEGGVGHSWNLVLFDRVADSVVTLAAYWLLFDPVDDIHQLKSVIRRCPLYTLGQKWKRIRGQEAIVATSPSDHQVQVRPR